jgi:hypothetical protein
VRVLSGESRTLFLKQGACGTLAADRGVHVAELTAAWCEAKMVLFGKRRSDAVDKFLSCAIEYASRVSQRCRGLSPTTATAAALVRSEERGWDEAVQAFKGATIVRLQGKLAHPGAGDELRASFVAMLSELDRGRESANLAMRARLRTLPAACSSSDVWISLAVVDAPAPTVLIEEPDMVWDTSLDGAEAMCREFADASLLPSVTGSIRSPDMQVECRNGCLVEEVATDGTREHTKMDDGSATGTKPVHVWHGDVVQAIVCQSRKTLSRC